MKQSTFEFTVEQGQQGKRLDAYLCEKIPDVSRSRIKNLIEQGFAKVDGAPCKPAGKTGVGQLVELTIPEVEPTEVEPQDIPLDILYEDADLIAINKPAGLVVHPAAGNPDRTLVNALLCHCTDLSGIGGILRPGIVHRLDKGTSGVIIAAKNDRAHHALAEQFASRNVLKKYLAVILGKPSASKGLWDQPIGRHPRNRKKMSVHSHTTRGARTRYELIGYANGVGALSLLIETGRTHQIRVHCATAGCPVAHDDLYSGIKRIPTIKDDALVALLMSLDRPALHAARLEIAHPTENRTMIFVAPLPEDMQNLFDAIGVNHVQ